jgi:hypothetical protein
MRHDFTAGAAGLKFMLDSAAMVHEPSIMIRKSGYRFSEKIMLKQNGALAVPA